MKLMSIRTVEVFNHQSPKLEDFYDLNINPARVVSIVEWPYSDMETCVVWLDADDEGTRRPIRLVVGSFEKLSALWSECMK